jgi:hypothetical protein
MFAPRNHCSCYRTAGYSGLYFSKCAGRVPPDPIGSGPFADAFIVRVVTLEAPRLQHSESEGRCQAPL